jgi:hypothetical protein
MNPLRRLCLAVLLLAACGLALWRLLPPRSAGDRPRPPPPAPEAKPAADPETAGSVQEEAAAAVPTLTWTDDALEIQVPALAFRVEGPADDILVHADGLDRMAQSGRPELPVFLHAFALPPGRRAEVEIVPGPTRLHTGLVPRAAESPRSDDEPVPARRPRDPAVYAEDALWPPEPARVVEAAGGDRRFARVEINPLQARPAAREIVEHLGLTVKVRLVSAPASSASAPPPAPSLVADACECSERIWRPETHWPTLRGNPADFARRRAGAEVDACVRIRITRQGLHRLGQPALVAAGIPAGDLVGAQLRLFHRDRELAVQPSTEGLFGPQDHVLFYAEPFLSYHTAENAVWLGFAAGGKRPATRPGAPRPGAEETQTACRRQTDERQREYVPALTSVLSAFVAQGGYQGWGIGTVAEPGNSTYPAVTLPFVGTDHRVPGTATLELLLWGVSVVDLQGTMNNADHRVSLRGQAGQEFASFGFPYRSRNPLSAPVPEGQFNAAGSTTTLSLLAHPLPGVDFDRSVLTWARLQFERTLVALQGQLHFGGAVGPRNHRVQGFSASDLLVWDVRDTAEPVALTGLEITPDAGGFAVRFGSNTALAPCFLAASAASAHAVAAADISTHSIRSLAEPGRQADVLLLAPAAFQADALRLLDHRDHRGLTVAVATFEDVYHEFGYGVRDPHALRQAIGYAYHHWRGETGRPLRYVALVGDGTFDPRRLLITEPEIAPVPVRPTHYDFTAVDQWLVSVSGDDALPDLAIGRFPAETAAHFTRMVDKTLAFENAFLAPTPPPWATATTFVSGNNENAGDTFSADTAALIADIVPPSHSVESVVIQSPAAANAARTSLPQSFTAGRSWINYMGHGTLDRWTSYTSPNPFDGTLAAGLTNSLRPVVTVFTCNNGLFQEPLTRPANPKREALMETLLRTATGGAAAMVAPTGKALHNVSLPMNRQFYQSVLNGKVVQSYTTGQGFTLVDGEVPRLGDAMLNAFLAVFLGQSTSARELEIYTIFGDPALQVRRP